MLVIGVGNERTQGSTIIANFRLASDRPKPGWMHLAAEGSCPAAQAQFRAQWLLK